MTVSGLNHFSIRTTDLARSRDFYPRALDLRDGERPPFPFPGHWMYCGEVPVIHLIGVEAEVGRDTGAVDHLAFTAHDLDGTRERLRGHGYDFEERTVPGMNLHQVFVRDPDGVLIELNFPGD